MRTLNDYFISGEMADVGSASSIYIPCPDGGRIVALAVTGQATSTGTQVYTIASMLAAGNSTAVTVTGASVSSVTFLLGETVYSEFTTGDGTEEVITGGGVKVTSDGGGTGGAAIITVTIRR